MRLNWLGLVRDSLIRPGQAADQIKSWHLSALDSFQLGALAIVVGTLLSSVLYRPNPDTVMQAYAVLMQMPVALAALQIAIMWASAGLAVAVGRWFGGTGTFRQSIGLMAWYQVMSTLFFLSQAIMFAAIPVLAVVLLFYALIWLVWALAVFIAELHGFENTWLVLAGIFVTLFAISLVVGLGATILGVTPVEA